MNFRKINIITGHYGSGKTNVSVNMALDLAEKGEKVTVVDLDIVNPYFRTAVSRSCSGSIISVLPYRPMQTQTLTYRLSALI